MRIVVSDTTANIKIDGAANPYKLINGLYYEFNTQSTHFITADKPIQVVQYAVTQGNEIDGKTTNKNDVGDPEMIFINPLEQNIDHVTLYSPHEYLILASYINVVIPTSAASSFLLDGAAPAGGFTTLPSNTAYSYGQFTVSNATHVISASKGFNAIAYGFGNAESYGYAAGTNVKNLNEFVQVVTPGTETIATTGCTNDNYIPQVAIPYQTSTITWDLGNGTTPTTQTNPTYADTLHRNDTILYLYNYGQPVAYAAGTYPIKVTVVDPISTVCGSTEEIDLNYTVVAPPQAKFAARDSVCTADTVGFKDLTDGSVNPIAKWHWDFGDGDTSNVQNPVYTYQHSGTYTVVLTTTGSTGCITSVSKGIHVSVAPVAKFSVIPPLCQAPLTIGFTDQSTAAEGKITAWMWDFGDNTTSIVQNPAHAYTAGGQNYTVSLTVVTDKGCTYTTQQTVFVNYSPTVDFAVPDVCQADNFAHFTALTSVTDSTTDKLTYQWNFGDQYANASYPNTASGKTAQHHYQFVGLYNVTLIVTTQNGCVKDTIKQLSVNGSNPHAAFSIPGNGSLCSNQPVTFINMADVPGFNQGKITSFTIDFGDGTARQTYRIDSGAVFRHQYPLAHVKAVTKYAVTMVAASGASAICSNTFTDTVRILPVPKTTFAPPDSVCQNFGTLQLAKYITEPAGAPAGSPTFLIDGIRSPDGTFNTATVGVGKHVITCYYVVSATSCADTTAATIKVEPAPAVYAGSPVIILAGAQAKLHATIVGGNNNVVSWLPTTGLSDPASAFTSASPSVTTKYKVTVTSTTDALACPATDSVTVTVLQPPIVPNTFTPNGDGINDKWVITNLAAYPDCVVSVYNRNGERVFYSVGYGIPWDGRYNSVNLPVGTYYYVIDPKNGRSIISGYVAIIR
jgi:gliding motility-associated-like protein